MRALAIALLVLLAAGSARAEPRSPWLGVGIESGAGGVRVNEVIPGTPAEYVGLRAGDEIVAIGERKLTAPDQLIALVGGHAIGDVVELKVVRKRKAFTVAVTLSARLDEREVLERRLLDRPAPGFALAVAAGRGGGALADHAGKVVVLEFLASWCEPCKSTYRALDRLDADRDVVVLGIASDAPATLAALAAAQSIGFSLLADPGGKVARAYHATKTPTLVVIDAHGTIRFVGMGAGPNLEQAVFAARAAARTLGE